MMHATSTVKVGLPSSQTTTVKESLLASPFIFMFKKMSSLQASSDIQFKFAPTLR